MACPPTMQPHLAGYVQSSWELERSCPIPNSVQIHTSNLEMIGSHCKSSKGYEPDLAALPWRALGKWIEECAVESFYPSRSAKKILALNRRRDSLTGSLTGRINVAKHQEIFWLLLFNIVPLMLLVVMQQLVFPNSVQVEKICYNDVLVGIDGCVITNCQWPVIVWPGEWSPNTDPNGLGRYDTT